MKAITLRILTLLLGLALPLLLAEGLLHLLPVTSGTFAEPVNSVSPIFRFARDRDFTWSRDWNFSIVNRGRTNNDGFVNDQPYVTEERRPLIGVVGDSYVEAFMVPYPQTFHGRLAADLAARMRCYSFAASGAPLSQLLVWMRHARRTYGAAALVVTVVGNDFDESLAEFKSGPGFHLYIDEDADLVLTRFDYAPGAIRGLVQASALARYLLLNLHADVTLSRLSEALGIGTAQAAAPAFVGNVPTVVDEHRLHQSQRAVAAFFRDLPAYADLPPERILFVIDGFRYAANLSARDSYFGLMRRHFMEQARARGYALIDADEQFIPYAAAHPAARFEWPSDSHWNPLAHQLIAQAILRSSWLAGLAP